MRAFLMCLAGLGGKNVTTSQYTTTITMTILRLVSALVALIAAALITRAEDSVLLHVDATNIVSYYLDTPDLSKYGTLTGPVIEGSMGRPFVTSITLGDIVTVNGKAAKGIWLARSFRLTHSTAPNSGQNIADINRGSIFEQIFEVLQPDGSTIGTLYTVGMQGGPAPPGAPATFASGAFAVTGGTGAWFGVRGESTNAVRLPEATATFRNTSATEDPANRRRLAGGGPVRIQFRLIPAERPEVIMVNGVPAIERSSDG